MQYVKYILHIHKYILLFTGSDNTPASRTRRHVNLDIQRNASILYLLPAWPLAVLEPDGTPRSKGFAEENEGERA